MSENDTTTRGDVTIWNPTPIGGRDQSGPTFTRDWGQDAGPPNSAAAARHRDTAALTKAMHEAYQRGDVYEAQALLEQRTRLGMARGQDAPPREDKRPEPPAWRSEPAPMDETAFQREIGALAAALLDGAPIERHPVVRGALRRFERATAGIEWDGTRDLQAAREFIRSDRALLDLLETVELDGVALGDHPGVIEMAARMGGLLRQVDRELGI